MGVHKLVLQMENQACIEVLQNEDHQGILNKCRSLINSSGWEIRLSHCYRED